MEILSKLKKIQHHHPQTSSLPACSILPQPSTLARVPLNVIKGINNRRITKVQSEHSSQNHHYVLHYSMETNTVRIAVLVFTWNSSNSCSSLHCSDPFPSTYATWNDKQFIWWQTYKLCIFHFLWG
jgi:hypothetical protein